MKNGVINEKLIGSVIHHCVYLVELVNENGVINEKWSAQ